MKRVLLMIFALLLAVVAGIIFASASNATEACHIEVSNGVATAVNCQADSHIATYKFKDGVSPGEANFDKSQPQTLFDDGPLSADIPSCAFQVDIFTGPVLQVIDIDHRYGDRLIAHDFGGLVPCEVVVSTSTTTSSTTTSTTSTTTTTTIPVVENSVILPPPVTLPQTGSSGNPLGMTGFGIILLGLGGVAICISDTIKSKFSKHS